VCFSVISCFSVLYTDKIFSASRSNALKSRGPAVTCVTTSAELAGSLSLTSVWTEFFFARIRKKKTISTEAEWKHYRVRPLDASSCSRLFMTRPIFSSAQGSSLAARHVKTLASADQNTTWIFMYGWNCVYLDTQISVCGLHCSRRRRSRGAYAYVLVGAGRPVHWLQFACFWPHFTYKFLHKRISK
jgi:hypothetical protein